MSLNKPDYRHTPFDLSGKTALITGASGGLGGRFAETLASAGANLVLAARDANNPNIQRLKQQLSGPLQVQCVSMDVGESESVARGFEVAIEQAGTINILINNAGIALPSSAAATDDAIWNKVLKTNLDGAWFVAREFADYLIDAGTTGAVVNITSILGQRVLSGLLSYAVSKAGLEQMTSALALEWARHGIRVNALAPGYIVTDMNRDFLESTAAAGLIGNIPQRAAGKPGDLDGALLLLAAAGDSFMTGSTVVVDGGHLNSTL